MEARAYGPLSREESIGQDFFTITSNIDQLLQDDTATVTRRGQWVIRSGLLSLSQPSGDPIDTKVWVASDKTSYSFTVEQREREGLILSCNEYDEYSESYYAQASDELIEKLARMSYLLMLSRFDD